MTLEHPPIALLRNVSTRRIIRALTQEGFQFAERQGSQRVYQHPDGRRVLIHYHRGSDTLPPYPIRNLLIGTHWTEDDLKRLGLMKCLWHDTLSERYLLYFSVLGTQPAYESGLCVFDTLISFNLSPEEVIREFQQNGTLDAAPSIC